MAIVAGNNRTGVKINLTYQAVGALSNAIPVSKIYNSANASVTALQSTLNSALLANEKAGGRYLGYFTPNTTGRWTVCIQDKNANGKVSKTYDVCAENLESIVSSVISSTSDVKSAVTVVGTAATAAGNAATSALGKAASALAQATSAANYASANVALISDAKSAALIAVGKATSALAQADSANNAAASALAEATLAHSAATIAAAAGSPASVS